MSPLKSKHFNGGDRRPKTWFLPDFRRISRRMPLTGRVERKNFFSVIVEETITPISSLCKKLALQRVVNENGQTAVAALPAKAPRKSCENGFFQLAPLKFKHFNGEDRQPKKRAFFANDLLHSAVKAVVATGAYRIQFFMRYIHAYKSPLGEMLLAWDDVGLTGLWFAGEKGYAQALASGFTTRETPLFDQARSWLDRYFALTRPDAPPPLHLQGTPFQLVVWNLLLEIPYGKTTTYGELAKLATQKLGKARMSAQAIGGAVGHNPISIIVPCHRVIGANGALTGYAGGLDKKARLLALEGICLLERP